MPVSSWVLPVSQQSSFVNIKFTSWEYESWVQNLSFFLPVGAAIFTGIVCFLGWWYQRALRVALKDVITDIEH